MTKSIDKMTTVEDFESALTDLLGEYSAVVKRVGEMVMKATSVLTADQYKELTRRLKDHGWTESLLDAARKVAEGELLSELVIVNVPVSKVLTLSMADQKRLVKGEKFPLKQAAGLPIEKAWVDMTSEEANQLLGPKGGHIHTPKEQKVANVPKKQVDHTTYSEARYDRHEAKFTFSRGRKIGEITIGELLNSLSDKGELDDANEAWQKKMTEMMELQGN